MRDRILEKAEQMVQDRGIDAVSFQDLADAVGLSKASVFHHFKNREALAQALIEQCRTAYGAVYDEIVGRDISAPDKLRAIAEMFEQTTEKGRICLLGALGSSVATLPSSAQQNLRLSVATTVDRFTRVFEQGRREGSLEFEGTPEQGATGFLALLQGLQMLTRARGDQAVFAGAAESYIETILS